MTPDAKKKLIGALVAAALAIAVAYGLIDQKQADSLKNQADQTLGTGPAPQQQPAPQPASAPQNTTSQSATPPSAPQPAPPAPAPTAPAPQSPAPQPPVSPPSKP